MTLRTRLTAAFVLVVLVPLLLGAAMLAVVLPPAMEVRQERGMTSSARLGGLAVTELCARARAAAEAAARAAAATDDLVVRDALRVLVSRDLADGVRVVDAAGRPRAVAGDAPSVPERDCGAGRLTREAGVVQLVATVRLSRAGGTVAGAAVAAVTIDDAYARELQRAVGTGEVALLAGGRSVAASGPVPAEVQRAALRARGQPVERGEWVAVVAEAGGTQPLAVMLVQDRVDPARVLPYVVGLALAAVVLAVGIAWALARAVTRPLEELSMAASRVAAGDLSTTIAVRSGDEVGRLAQAFNTMTEELRSYVGELRSSRLELQAGAARLGDTLSATHDLDRILAVVLETALGSTRAAAGAVLLVGDDRREVELAAGSGLAAYGVPERLRVPLGEGIVGEVAASGSPVLGRSGSGGLRPGPGEPAGTTVVAVPLRSSTTVIGVLVLWDRAGGEEFTEDDLRTLRAFTGQAAVAVDNVLLHEETRRHSLTDGLTGLWNYRYFKMTIGQEIERAARFSRPLTLLLLDLDHFKLVNDVHGHQRGDAALVELAGRVRAQVRDVDAVARYGGEEFVVILPETDQAGARRAAERIRDAVRRRPFGEDGEDGEEPIDLTISIGVAVLPDHGTASTTLLRRADEALYAAKRAGRDTWRLAAADPVEDPRARSS